MTEPTAVASDASSVATDPEEGPVAAEPVELLVTLAERGEIDPWDVDIVAATDAFLAHLDAGDLRTTGRALFYAAVLLRMKSDVLLQAATDDPGPEEDLFDPDVAPMPADGDPIDALELEIDRRLDRKRARGTPRTLDELVYELREAERETWWKQHRTYDTSASPTGYARGTQTLDYHHDDAERAVAEPTAAAVTDTAHAEEIELTIESVHAAIDQTLGPSRTALLFAELHVATAPDVVVYLALLFMAHRGQITLRQDLLFGDLWIEPTSSFRAG
jgi:segregation and condensation protein A